MRRRAPPPKKPETHTHTHTHKVLVHMRLMNAARKNKTHSAIHIQPLDPKRINKSILNFPPKRFRSPILRRRFPTFSNSKLR